MDQAYGDGHLHQAGQGGHGHRVEDGVIGRDHQPGPTARASRKAAGAAADNLVHQRQRGEGGDPVGVSSRIQPMQTNPRYRVAGL